MTPYANTVWLHAFSAGLTVLCAKVAYTYLAEHVGGNQLKGTFRFITTKVCLFVLKA